MSPCSPNDISIDIPTTPGPSIPGFGSPHAIKAPDINPFPDGMPEDLMDIMDKLQLIIPPGVIKPSLNPNFGKDVFDGIMKLLDQFMPFLMLYKFFLPVLNMIICIIEVLCAIPNPFKLAKAITKLFTQCIPAFLSLFPMFALVVMIISLLMLLLALIEYIIVQILNLVEKVLHNINMLQNAFQEANTTSVLKIAKKIGSILCLFQNLFVLLAIFTIIIQVIKDILNLVFAIPPCDDNNSDDDGCCTTDVCPAIVKNNYTRNTGKLKYLNSAGTETTISLPPPIGTITTSARTESWQLFDEQQEVIQKFINVVNAFDVPTSSNESPPFFKPVFFPSDAVYNAKTPIKQAAYTVDLKFFYNPSAWGRSGKSRYIIFKDCIVIAAPTNALKLFNNGINVINNGVLSLAGGKGFEEDSVTLLTGFSANGITPISDQATLENFLHLPNTSSMQPNDGQVLSNVEYTFKPNLNILLQKSLVTTGCLPEVALSKEFINNTFAGDALMKLDSLKKLSFPDVNLAQECLTTALNTLRFNLTPEGVADFQSTSEICLNQLKKETSKALESLIVLGFDPCKSTMTIDPNVQFTSKIIKLKVTLNETNGLPLAVNMSQDVGENLSSKLKAYVTFGKVSKFTYEDNMFLADISSDFPGAGKVMVSFDDTMLCKNTINPVSHTLQELDYNFVYAPAKSVVKTGVGDTEGMPARDEADQGREGIGNLDKDVI